MGSLLLQLPNQTYPIYPRRARTLQLASTHTTVDIVYRRRVRVHIFRVRAADTVSWRGVIDDNVCVIDDNVCVIDDNVCYRR